MIKTMKKAVDWLVGEASVKPVKQQTVQQGYQQTGPSFPDHWAMVDFCDEKIPFLMKQWTRFNAGDQNVRWLDMWLCVVLEDWMEKNSITE